MKVYLAEISQGWAPGLDAIGVYSTEDKAQTAISMFFTANGGKVRGDTSWVTTFVVDAPTVL